MLLGARQFFERRGAPTPPLPYDAEVEYLESTGTQWIDTGFAAKSDTKVICDALWTNNASSDSNPNPTLFGVRSSSSTMFEVLSAVGLSAFYQYGAQSKNYSSSAYGARHVYTADANKLYIDDVLVASAFAASFVNTRTLVLFALNNNGFVSRFVVAEMYGLSVYDNGSIVRDYIPVRFTNEQGISEGAMYDRLGVGGMDPDGSPRTDGLYRNRGTGAFTIGPDKS